MKKLLSTILSITLLCNVYVFSDIVTVSADSNNPVLMGFITGKTGNIFFAGDISEVSFVYNNGGSVNLNLTAVCSAVGSKGNVVWTSAESIQVPGYDHVIKKVTWNLDEDIRLYDTYTMRMEITDTNNNVSGLAETPFSYVRSSMVVPRNEGFGINTHFPIVSGQSDATMGLVKKAGISMIRDECSWVSYEQQKGVYAIPSEVNKYINNAIANNVDVLINFSYGNILYTPTNSSVPYYASELQAFANYASSLTDQLKGRVKYFEVWNEMNTTGNFNYEGRPASAYAQLIKTVYPAVKSANPDAEVIGMATTGTDTTWMANVLDNGGGPYMNAVSCHPYRWEASPNATDLYGRLKSVQNLIRMPKYNLDYKMWLTELGWGSVEGITEYDKAVYLAQSYIISQEVGSVEKYFWYDFICDGANSTDREQNFGLLNPASGTKVAYSARPAYLAAANMNNMLSTARLNQKTEPRAGSYVYEFDRDYDTAKVYAMWTVNGADSISMDMLSQKIKVYDVFGNATVKTSNTGTFTLDLTAEPIYVELCEDDIVADIDYHTGLVTLSGAVPSKKSGELVGINVYYPGKTYADLYVNSSEAIVYNDQCTSGERGQYSFSFTMEGPPGIYKAYVNSDKSDTAKVIELDFTLKFDGEISVQKGGVSVDQLSDISTGDLLNVAAKITNTRMVDGRFALFFAFYKNGEVSNIKCLLINISKDEAEKSASMDVSVDNMSNIDRIKVFLWNADNIMPICGNVELK